MHPGAAWVLPTTEGRHDIACAYIGAIVVLCGEVIPGAQRGCSRFWRRRAHREKWISREVGSARKSGGNLSDAPCNWVDRPFGGCGYGNDDAKRDLNVNAVRMGGESLGVVHLV